MIIRIDGTDLINAQNVTIQEDGWIGIGAASERIAFDGSGDQIDVLGGAKFRISHTTPEFHLVDTTAAAKSLKIDVDANIAQLREVAGASGSLMTLDLVNNRVGVGTVVPLSKFHVEVGDITIRGTAGAEEFGLIYREPTVNGILGGITFNRTEIQNAPVDIVFGTNKNNDGGAQDEVMRIKNSGYVGINQPGPDRRLDLRDATDPQVRLTQTDGTVYVEARADISGNLTFTVTGTKVIANQWESVVVTGTAPLLVASTTLVTNLNADRVDSAHASVTPTVSTIPISDGANKLAAGWLSEVLALADLSDVAAKTGTGTTVVMDTSPTIVSPIINSAGTGSSVTMGTGAGSATVVGKANANTTAVGNVGVGEDDLITYSLPANSLSANGKGVRITVWGTTANNANAKTVRLYFGTAAILTTSLTVSQVGVWKIDGVVIRTGASAQEATASLLQGGATTLIDVEQSAPVQVETGALTIKCTGDATADNDLIQEGLLVEFLN